MFEDFMPIILTVAASAGGIAGIIKGYIDARRAHKRRLGADVQAIRLIAESESTVQEISNAALGSLRVEVEKETTTSNGSTLDSDEDRLNVLRKAVGTDQIATTYFDYHREAVQSSRSYSVAALSFVLVTGLVVLIGIVVALFGLIAPGVMIELASVLPGGIAKLLHDRANDVRSEAQSMYRSHAESIGREHRFRQAMETASQINGNSDRDAVLAKLAVDFAGGSHSRPKELK